MALALVGAGVISFVLAPSGERQDTQGQLAEQGGAKPHIIPLPNSGTKPKEPGDRGGWEQFLTLGLIVVGVTGLALLAWRGARKAKEGRQAWLAAAEAGRDKTRGQPVQRTPAKPRAPAG